MGNYSRGSKLKRYYSQNIGKIFFIGFLIGISFLAVHVVVRTLESEKYIIKFQSSLNAQYELAVGQKAITEKECYNVITQGEYAREIEDYLGNYISFDEFKDNIKIKVEEGKIKVSYINDSSVRAKRIANIVVVKLVSYLNSEARVNNIKKEGKASVDKIKVLPESKISMSVVYFTEIGFAIGWIFALLIFCLIYYSNGRIKTKEDVEDELHLPVLAELPYIKNLSN